MSVYKPFKREYYSITPFEVNKKISVASSSMGVFSRSYLSGSLKANGVTPTESGSYWQSLRINFYLSGSDLAMRNNSGISPEPNKYSSRMHSIAPIQTEKDYYLSKFNDKGVMISIPQEYWGNNIKRGSFELIDTSTSTTIEIKDDSYGNLYSSNASISASGKTSISSSENYVGNIFYNVGIVTITDTGSHSSGNLYPTIGKKYRMNFESSDIIYQKDYTITINTNDYNVSNNPTSRKFEPSSSLVSGRPIDAITGSNWAPFLTTIGFYNRNHELVMIARYPQPIKLKKDTNLTFKIRQDW